MGAALSSRACTVPCMGGQCPNACAGQIDTIVNGMDMFQYVCSAFGSCAQSVINFEYTQNGFVEHIERVSFTEQYAGYGATINVINKQTAKVVKINKLDCSVATACNNLSVYLDNADLGDVNCPYPSYCADCMVYQVGKINPKTGELIGEPCFYYFFFLLLFVTAFLFYILFSLICFFKMH